MNSESILRWLIGENKIIQAIDLVTEISKENKEIGSEILLIKSRFKAVEKKERLGGISNSEATEDRNKIKFNLIEIIDQIRGDSASINFENSEIVGEFISEIKNKDKIIGKYATEIEGLKMKIHVLKEQLIELKDIKGGGVGTPQRSILFSYLRAEPENKGWVVRVEGNGVKPRFKLKEDNNRGIYLKIANDDSYYMDYVFEPAHFFFEEISFIAKLEQSSILYLKIAIFNEPSEKEIPFWLKIHYGQKSRLPVKESDGEWIVHVPLEPLENGWSRVTLNIPNEYLKIKAKRDWTFERLIAIRLRGSLSISRIDLR